MDTEKQQKTVPDAMAGLRLDQALARMFPDYSRSRLKAWLIDGAVLVNGEKRRPKDRVDGGEVREIRAGEVFFPPYRDREVYEKFRDGVIAAGLPA